MSVHYRSLRHVPGTVAALMAGALLFASLVPALAQSSDLDAATAAPPAAADAAAPPPEEEEQDGAAQAAEAAVEPYAGSLGKGLAELAALAGEGRHDEALALAERLLAPDAAARVYAWVERRAGETPARALATLAAPLAALGLDLGSSAERGEVHFARGVTLRRAERDADARAAFQLVRGLGGGARADAVYELAHIDLVAGERWREQLPERQQGAPATPPAKGDPDPLVEAKRAYQAAEAALIERLRLDWRDADTRANLELVRRRLRELDEIERRRKEEEQKKKQDEQSQQDPKGEKDKQQKQDEQQDPKQDEGEGQSEDPSQDQETPPEEQPPSEEDAAEPEESEEPEESSESEAEENVESSTEDENPPEPQSPEEREMTKEEMQKLLQQLEEHRRAGEEIQRQLRERRRRAATRDW